MSLLQFKNIRFVPVVHRRLTFAEQVRRAALEHRPDAIAVELPETLAVPVARGIARLPQLTAVCWSEPGHARELFYLPIDPCDAIIEAARLALEHDLALECIDADLPGLVDRYLTLPDDLIIDSAGFEPYLQAVLPSLRLPEGIEPDVATQTREAMMALRLDALAERHELVLCVLGLGHFERVRARLEQRDFAIPPAGRAAIVAERPDARLARLAPESLVEMLGEIPYVTHLYEQLREEQSLTGEAAFDKLGALQAILKHAQQKYTATYRETIGVTQWKALLQFTRNLAIVRGGLRPDFYELVIGARGTVDGDYGYEVYEHARSYPPMAPAGQALGGMPGHPDHPGAERSGEPGHQAGSDPSGAVFRADEAASAPSLDDLPQLRVRGPRGVLQDHDEKFLMRPRRQQPEHQMIRLRFRRRPSHAMKQQWRDEWQKRGGFGSICSWPPEDDRQERFMDFVRKRAMQVLTDDRRHVEEFSTQMLDGLDIRETTRNWHTGKLYVHQTPQPRGKVGSVVVIWEDQPLDHEPSWRTTFYAEHQNESDIAFFATPLGDHVVGPRIARTEFNGILSVYPAWGIPDVWKAIYSRDFTHCSDVLLAAGIVFSPHKYVAYVADRPPSPFLRSLAADFKRHIIYLPRGMFSRRRLRQVRRFHILEGHAVRRWARDYIFDDD